MALTDGRYRARHTLRIGGTLYRTGDLILGSIFSDDSQVQRYIKNGHVDMQAANAAEIAGGVVVEAEGVQVAASASTLNFVGATVTDAGNGQADVEFAAPAGGGLPQDGGGTFTQNNLGDVAAGFANAAGTIRADGQGGFAFGTVYGSAQLLAGAGATAFGYVAGSSYGTNLAMLRAASPGALAMGYIDGSGVGAGGSAQIDAGQRGTLVVGTVDTGNGHAGPALVRALGLGAWAGGRVKANNNHEGSVTAQGRGSFAMGEAYSFTAPSTITAYGAGSMAFGRAYHNQIRASNDGSFAFGESTDGVILAAAENAAQFFPGTNYEAGTLSVGTGPRLKGTVGAPAAPRNGDFWVDATGNVMVRTGGASKSLSGLA